MVALTILFYTPFRIRYGKPTDRMDQLARRCGRGYTDARSTRYEPFRNERKSARDPFDDHCDDAPDRHGIWQRMSALVFGLLAALAWGVHDICVRFVSQTSGILPALGTVLISGAVMLIPVCAVFGVWTDMTARATGLSVAAGAVYVIGCVGLYNAFAIGPVRLVAPILGTYPILSVGWSAVQGEPVAAVQWLAVGAVIAGIACVSLLTRDAASEGHKGLAIAWSVLGSLGFAGAFAIGQQATLAGAELPVVMISRLAAAGCVLILLVARKVKFETVRPQLPILILMGALDATALGAVIASGGLPDPEFAAVGASVFGLVTILLAWAFLGERVSLPQWGGIAMAFAGIGYLAT